MKFNNIALYVSFFITLFGVIGLPGTLIIGIMSNGDWHKLLQATAITIIGLIGLLVTMLIDEKISTKQN